MPDKRRWSCCAWICHGTITDVVGQILANEQVICVVDNLIGFAIGVSACVQNFQLPNTTTDGPARVGEFVLYVIFGKPLNLVITQIWITEENAVSLEFLDITATLADQSSLISQRA